MIEKLVLGTVQLGLEYGINNKHGKPSPDYSYRLLDKAYEIGIRIFDTANAYGNAEEVIGEWIRKNGIAKKIKIISKLKPNIFEDGGDVKEVIRNQINCSLELLNINSLEGYLFHTPAYVYRDDILEAMVDCRDAGLISNCGVSVYEEEDALYAADNKSIDYIQVPYNVLDQRLDKTDFFTIAKANKKTVFARSPFVQGLIFLENDSIPEHLIRAREYLKSFDEIISQYNLTRLDAAMLFPFCNSGNDYVIFGVDTMEQLIDDCNVVINNRNIDECISSLKKEFGVTEKAIVIPSLWKK